jgi:hypothetical protein
MAIAAVESRVESIRIAANLRHHETRPGGERGVARRRRRRLSFRAGAGHPLAPGETTRRPIAASPPTTSISATTTSPSTGRRRAAGPRPRACTSASASAGRRWTASSPS